MSGARRPKWAAARQWMRIERRYDRFSAMTKLLQKGIEAVQGLPADRQDMAGELLLGLAGISQSTYQLTPEQIADLKVAIAQADRGEFASDEDMKAVWKKFGL